MADRPDDSRAGRRVAAVLLAYVLAGILAGVLWAWLADPVQFTVVGGDDGPTGLQAGEEAASARFGVVVTYAAVAVVASALTASVVCLRTGPRAGAATVVWLAVAGTVGAAVSALTGIALGPGDPEAAATSAAVGDTVADRLAVDAWGVLLVWPVAALAVAMVVWTFLLPRDEPVDPAASAEAQGPGRAPQGSGAPTETDPPLPR
ncbi:hypothetical protein [Mumia flava]|nr:hypothetical protein [Mumia flava]